MTEEEKMKAGEWYDANYNEKLVEDRNKAGDLTFDMDHLKPSDPKRYEILKQVLQVEELPKDLEVKSPFYVDYGYNIHFGERNHINLGCYFMDGAPITLGDDEFIGPYCGFYTANHHPDHEIRNQGIEKALPITIGSHCWFGANVTIMPGVTIGEGCIIAAGAVVASDIPAYSLAAGVPAKVKKSLK